jgi:cell wall-associated NlpC family hydrolase
LLGILAALLVAAPEATADPIEAKRAEAQRVLGELSMLDASLGAANERLNLANIKLDFVRGQVEVNKRELRIARQNLSRGQKAIANRLVTLYTKGENSPLEVILGAKSLSEVLSRIESENRVSSLDAQVIEEVKTYGAAVKAHKRRLATQMKQVRTLIAQRAAEKRFLESQIVQRQQLLQSLNGEIQRLIAAQQAAELRRAQAAQAAYFAAQSRRSQSAGTTTWAETATFGATAATPEGATVVPSSSYTGAVGVAMSQLGTPYVWGGSGPGGFDCSGLVTYAYGKMGVSLPHSSYALWNEGVAVPSNQLEPGDLVFFSSLGHMGMYIGDGQYVHAPRTGDVVKVSSMSSHGGYVGARRILSR